MLNTSISEPYTNRLAIAVIYLSAFLQGLAMVSFAASSTVLKDGKGFSDAQYGLIFIPQIATTIVGSLVGGALARQVGLTRILLAALIATGLSQIGLAVAVTFTELPGTFYLVLGSTAMFGLAFGLGAAPLNTYPGMIFPNKTDTALVALHTLLGVGLATGPLLVGPLATAGFWLGYPLLLLIGATTLSLLLFGARLPAYLPQGVIQADRSETAKPLTRAVLWVFVAIAVLYAFAEGSFVIGPLRQAFTIAELYRFSTVYPLGALLLALGVILSRLKLADFKTRTCKLVLGHHC